ncbi:MAG: thiamine phosphate synthase [Clostridiales bacterium]|nr:thiamine phosphate synthase [Clostridiales bacterium]
MERGDRELHRDGIVCVTNRKLCRGDGRPADQIFLQRISEIAECHPAGIILREKDLSESGYETLAIQVMDICSSHGVQCILHSFTDVALKLKAQALHVPLPVLRGMTAEQKASFRVLGASCHSVEDAREAERLGCTYITAGHIFDTDCKRGLPGRGLDFLREVCVSVDIPVYAIGGITPVNATNVRRAGAAGICVMSSLMQCEDPAAEMKAFSASLHTRALETCR